MPLSAHMWTRNGCYLRGALLIIQRGRAQWPWAQVWYGILSVFANGPGCQEGCRTKRGASESAPPLHEPSSATLSTTPPAHEQAKTTNSDLRAHNAPARKGHKLLCTLGMHSGQTLWRQNSKSTNNNVCLSRGKPCWRCPGNLHKNARIAGTRQSGWSIDAERLSAYAVAWGAGSLHYATFVSDNSGTTPTQILGMQVESLQHCARI